MFVCDSKGKYDKKALAAFSEISDEDYPQIEGKTREEVLEVFKKLPAQSTKGEKTFESKKQRDEVAAKAAPATAADM